MQFPAYLSSLPAPATAAERRQRSTVERGVASLERKLGKGLDLSKARWDALTERLPGYTAIDWREALANPSKVIDALPSGTKSKSKSKTE